ncbi:hypothetical protein CMQ_265 [Grosmannia clavigera kw1407]|uniref:Uncharacterized protein n=1 Tax=Grosmannia clavigera (strain kw1407 / UAMH 11150) TaxID=655863 RepID=F0XQU7_GROCL|nr:uncharacterized protein CMQ_265 [Grosmannia clavigera kw1407]EFW99947.1 hypothetical protein CMQ_265 [Grosmannia clavigera kw1407]
MRGSSNRYTKGLLQDDFLDEEEELLSAWLNTSQKWRKYWSTSRSSIVVTGALATSNLVALLVILHLLAVRPLCDLPLNEPPQRVTPSLAHLVRKPVPEFINVTFFPDGSFFRQHNSKEADAKWDEYDGSKEAEQAGIDPARHAYVDRPDLGAVGYPVLPEAVHHMHCVSMLRKNLYYNINHTRQDCHPPTCESPELEEWRIFHVGMADRILTSLRSHSDFITQTTVLKRSAVVLNALRT